MASLFSVICVQIQNKSVFLSHHIFLISTPTFHEKSISVHRTISYI